MKANKKLGLSNWRSRWIGAGIGVITSLPIASSVATMTFEEKPSTFSQFNNALIKGLTGTKINDASTKVYNFSKLTKSTYELISVKDDVAKIFNDPKNIDLNKFNDSKVNDLNNVLNSGIINTDSLKAIFGDTAKNIDFTIAPSKINLTKKIVFKSQDVENEVLESIAKTFGKDKSNPADVKKYLVELGLMA